MVVFTIPHTLVGLGLIAATLYLAAFELLAPTETGTVETINPIMVKGHRQWSVSYFWSREGRRHEESHSYGAEPSLTPGATFPVKAFVLAGIAYATPVDEHNPLGVLCLLCFAVFWNLIIGTAHYQLWVVPRQLRRLVREGQPVVGEVIGKKIRTGRRGSASLRYRFESLGAPVEDWMLIRPEEFDAVAIGAKVTVLFDPDRPRRNVLYAYGPWKVAGG